MIVTVRLYSYHTTIKGWGGPPNTTLYSPIHGYESTLGRLSGARFPSSCSGAFAGVNSRLTHQTQNARSRMLLRVQGYIVRLYLHVYIYIYVNPTRLVITPHISILSLHTYGPATANPKPRRQLETSSHEFGSYTFDRHEAPPLSFPMIYREVPKSCVAIRVNSSLNSSP